MSLWRSLTGADRREELDREIAASADAMRKSGVAGGNLVEVGWVRRGVRGVFSHDVRLTNEAVVDWLYREVETDEPVAVKLMILIPGPGVTEGVDCVIGLMPSPRVQTQ